MEHFITPRASPQRTFKQLTSLVFVAVFHVERCASLGIALLKFDWKSFPIGLD